MLLCCCSVVAVCGSEFIAVCDYLLQCIAVSVVIPGGVNFFLGEDQGTAVQCVAELL